MPPFPTAGSSGGSLSGSSSYHHAPVPPPRRDNSRLIAAVLAILVVGGSGGAVWYGLQIALKNQQIQSAANRIQETYAKGAALYQAGRFLEAAPLFQKVRLDPAASVEMISKAAEAEAFCYRMVGQRAQDAKEFAVAEQWFQKAVAVAPNDISAQEELRAVQKAIAILSGREAPPGTPAVNTGSSATVGQPAVSAPSPNPAETEAMQRAQDARALLERGNQLLREGHRLDACREWHEANLLAPGSPAAVQATQLRRANCPDFGG